MNGFNALADLKDKMMRPLYEKRRHFGCQGCGKTFYGYYQKSGFRKVPDGTETPHPTQRSLVILGTYDDVFYPDCPDCMSGVLVSDAKDAIATRDYEAEKKRKNKEAAQKRRETIEEKRRAYSERVNHVRANPQDITDDESRNYNFLCAMINIPKYGSDPDIFWRRGEQNGHLTIEHHMHHQGQSRSGKTHHYYNWFDILDHRTGQTYQVSHFVDRNGKNALKGYRPNIFENQIPTDAHRGCGDKPLGKATSVPLTNGQGKKGRTMLKVVSKQRQLSADLSLEDQVSNLSSLIKNPPQNSRVIEVSPELASYVLENLNIGNRSKKIIKIKTYASDMASGNWSLTNATLAFGSDGYLKDGQNRLSACVRSGKPFKTHAIFGIEPESFIHMDVGANRTHMDVFTIMGTPYPSVTGAVIRHIVAFKNQKASSKNVSMTNDDLRSYYNDEINSSMLELAIKLAKITKKNTLIPVPPLAALFYIVSMEGNLEKAKSFLNDLAANYGKGVRSPVRKLLHTLTEIRVANRNKIMPDVMSILLARTWVNYKEGRASTKADMVIGADAAMPKL